MPQAPNRQPRLSIITVVRDDRRGLMHTHASLRCQIWRDFAWIVVDGDSHDGTLEYLTAHLDEVAWWRSAPDRGLYDAMNIGLEAASGDYVLFLNAGDALAGPDTLAWLADEIAAAGWPDLIYGDALEPTIGGGVMRKPARSYRTVWYGMFTHHQAMLYRRSAVAGLRYDLSYPLGADYAYTLDLLNRGARAVRVRGPIALCAPGGLSQRHPAQGRREQDEIRRLRLGLPRGARIAIRVAQTLAMAVRRWRPELFELVRGRRCATRTSRILDYSDI